jgi:hypothetical protein
MPALFLGDVGDPGTQRGGELPFDDCPKFLLDRGERRKGCGAEEAAQLGDERRTGFLARRDRFGLVGMRGFLRSRRALCYLAAVRGGNPGARRGAFCGLQLACRVLTFFVDPIWLFHLNVDLLFGSFAVAVLLAPRRSLFVSLRRP